MAEYDNTNRGIIGRNRRKSTDSHPDISGSINVAGVEYWIDGWKKARKDGDGFVYSLSVREKDSQPMTSAAKPTRAKPAAPVAEDDDIPF